MASLILSGNRSFLRVSAPVAEAVSKSPVHTVGGPDERHDKVYRAYRRRSSEAPPLDGAPETPRSAPAEGFLLDLPWLVHV